MYGFYFYYENESGEVEDMFWSGDDVGEVLDIACVTASLTCDSIPVYYYPGDDGSRELYCTAIPASRAAEYPLHNAVSSASEFLAALFA